MTLNLPERWESFLASQIGSGRYASREEVMDEALRLLEARIRDEAETLEGIQRGIADVDAGRTLPVAESFSEIRTSLSLS